MSLPSTKIKQTGGFWSKQPNGKMMWANSDKYGNVLTLIDPLQLVGFERECTFKLIFVKEVNDSESFCKLKKFYCQSVHVKIRDDVSDNILLRFMDRRWFLSDISPLGYTEIIPLISDDVVVVEKSKPYPITQTEAQAIMKESAFAFGRVEQNSDGSFEYYLTV